MTNAQKLRKLATLAENDVFAGAMIISKLEQLSEFAVKNPKELDNQMKESGASNMISTEVVLRAYQQIYDIVKIQK